MGMVMELLRIPAADLDDYLADDTRLKAQIYDGEGDAPSLYLDKAWHGLHFLLCGDSWEAVGDLGQALMGGDSTEIELGYGPVSCVDPEQVKKTAAALAEVDEQALRDAFDPDVMNEEEVYPSIWDDPDAVDYPLSHLEGLQVFYADAAEAGDAVLLVMT